jgi:hypothetical protein
MTERVEGDICTSQGLFCAEILQKEENDHANHRIISANASTNGLTLCAYSHFGHMIQRFNLHLVTSFLRHAVEDPRSFCTGIKLSGPGVYAGNIGEVETPPESAALFSHSGRFLLCLVHPQLQLMLLSRDNQKHASWMM